MSLRALIQKYHFTKELREHTHTSFGENRIKKLSVPAEEREQLYATYVSYCNKASKELLEGKGLNSITEKAKRINNFFVDLDLKIDTFETGLITIEEVGKLMRTTFELFQKRLNFALNPMTDARDSDDDMDADADADADADTDAFSFMEVDGCFESDENNGHHGNKASTLFTYVTAFRGKYKCHLYFPGVPLTVSQSEMLCKDVEQRLEKMYPWVTKAKFIDTSVYKTGLRLIWSHKGIMGKSKDGKPTEEDEHVRFFGADVPYEKYYRLGVLKDDGEIAYVNRLTLEDLKKTSIVVESGVDPLQFRRQYLEKVVDSLVKQQQPSLRADVFTTHGVGSSLTTAADSDVTNEQATSEIPPRLSFLVREYLKQAIDDGLAMSTQGLLSIKMNEYGNVMVVLPPQHCPIAQRIHRRTETRNVPANYVIMNAFQCSLRCFDENCTQVITLPNPNEELYDLLREHCKDFLLKRSLYKQTDETISQYIFSLMRNHYATSPSNTSYIWYYYDATDHKWVKRDKIMTAIMSDTGHLQKSYKQYVDSIQRDSTISEEDKKTVKTLWLELETNLQTTRFVRHGLLPLLASKLDHYWSALAGPRHKNFQSRLDDNPLLLGCKNGVLDLSKGIFRAGHPTDFISMSTNINYIPWEQCSPELKAGLDGFLQQIFLREDHKKYVMKEMSKSLNGTQQEQRFFLFTGGGANGKSTLIKLFDYTFGDYTTKVGITMFTKPRPPSNVPQSDTIALKGARFVYCEEPNAKEPLNLGTIKSFTGGDKQTANDKFEKQQVFYLQATFICSTNEIPPINASVSDYGTWRRMKPVMFNARFVEEPNPDRPNEFKTDDNIENKLKSWAEVFLSYIVHMYLDMTVVPVPKEFRALWNELQNKNDLYSRFVSDYVLASDSFTESIQIWEAFKVWSRTMGVGKDIRYDTFEKHMTYQMGNMIVNDEGRKGWNIEIKTLPNVF